MKKEKEPKEVTPPEPKEETPSLIKRIVQKEEAYSFYGRRNKFRTAQGRRIFGFDPNQNKE